jgi:tetratricopeptide (TPR) repeat protein
MSVRGVIKKHRKSADKLLKAKKLPEAQRILFEICKLAPNDEQAWLDFAAVAIRLNHLHDAQSALQRALTINPNLAEPYFELAEAQVNLANYVEADKNFRAFLQLHPDSGKGNLALAKLLKRSGHPNEAEAYFRKALEHSTDNQEAHLELGETLQQQGSHEEALSHLLKAHELQPGSSRVCNALGAYYRDAQDFDKALSSFQQAFELSPTDKAIYLFYVASVYEMQGYKEKALQHYEQALELDPNFIDARLRRAPCLLSLGRLQEGFAEYEYRLQHTAWRQCNYVNNNIPLWRGEALNGKRILVVAEQGHGDNIQFSRYLPLLAEQECTVDLYCKPELESLLGTITGVVNVITKDEKISPRNYDYCAYIMSLAHHFQTDLETIPQVTPYLSAPTNKIEYWKKRLDTNQLKVGLVWAGNPSHQRNAFRSMPLNEFSPLANIPYIQFISLQKGIAAQEAKSSSDFTNLLNLDSELNDFSDTAAAITNLDLVITVDTATAHLAGALGKPVWTLVYFPAEWRWLESRNDSPWYPSMRLYRQQQTGKWDSLIQEIAQALRSFSPAAH